MGRQTAAGLRVGVKVSVGVLVAVGVAVWVAVGVEVSVTVGVDVSVEVGVGEEPVKKPPPIPNLQELSRSGTMNKIHRDFFIKLLYSRRTAGVSLVSGKPTLFTK